MSQTIRRILWYIGFCAVICAAVFLVALQLTTRFAYPEYTETQLFLNLLKPMMFGFDVLILGGLLAATNKDAL